MRKLGPSGIVLVLIAITQMIAGGMIATGCLCNPNSHLVGLVVSFSMATVVSLFAGLAVMSRKHPRSAVATAALLEGIVIIMMLWPLVQPSLSVWYAQGVVYVLVCIATVQAFRA